MFVARDWRERFLGPLPQMWTARLEGASRVPLFLEFDRETSVAGRLRVRQPRREGPTPFTSAWHQAPQEAVVRRPALQLPDWMPSERTMSAFFVLVLTLTISLLAAGRTDHSLLGAQSPMIPAPGSENEVAIVQAPSPEATISGEPAGDADAAEATSVAEAISAGEATGVADGPTTDQAGAQATTPPVATVEATAAFAPMPAIGAANAAPYDPQVDGLLPHNRIVAYYGHPHDDNMGILGEHTMEEVHQLLLEEAERYQIADPTRPVIPTFEIIATVAQRVPGADGTYLLDTDIKTLTEWVNYASDHDMHVILDVQVGRSSVAMEFEKVRSLLLRPNVHLAIDPEFAVAEGQTPGLHIGSVWAESIRYAQEELAAMVEANGLPPKMLIVHQFREDMIKEKETLGPVPGVQLVIDADGFGDPDLKKSVYNILVRDEPVEFAGIKLFYKQDKPLLEPDEVTGLNPSPDVVIIQ